MDKNVLKRVLKSINEMSSEELQRRYDRTVDIYDVSQFATIERLIMGNDIDYEVLKEAVELVRSGKAKRMDLSDKVSVYKAGSVTRVDIKD